MKRRLFFGFSLRRSPLIRRIFAALATSALLGLLVAPVALAARPAGFDLYGLLRAGRWDDVSRLLGQRDPQRLERDEQYATGLAVFQQLGGAGRGQLSAAMADGFQRFLAAADIPCPNANSELALVACVRAVPEESRSAMIERLALWKAAEYAEKHGFDQLRETLLERASLSIDDPLTGRILANRLALLVQSGRSAAAAGVAERALQIGGPHAELFKARAFRESGDATRAFRHYVKAMQSTRAEWLNRAIAGDVRSHYRGQFTGEPLGGRSVLRDLTQFSSHLDGGEITALKNRLSSAEIIQSANSDRVLQDGVFLIRSGRAGDLARLARAAYTHLSHSPETLYAWTVLLKREKSPHLAAALIEQFSHVKGQSPGLWQLYLDILEERGDRDRYFQEVVAYLHDFHAYYSVQDRLINFLIGEDHKNIRWADDRYWVQANQILPAQTGKGRFVYWLHRYYQHKGDRAGVERVRKNFYAMAPGSFYAGAFWDEGRAGDFTSDWRGVLNREDYLEWVAKHGNNEEALEFLGRRNLLRYMDPRALEVWKQLETGYFNIPDDMLLLYRMGEFSLGQEFFDYLYEGKVSRRESIARRAYIGMQSGNLHMSVYFTRWLLREDGVAEDPFSLPGGLLKTLYPRPYRQEVLTYSRKYNISEYKVYALMRQESMFQERAISRSGARGLMQIMPRTGQWLADKLRMGTPDLMDVDTNINLGAKYFADLINQYGDFRWAAIAYNGGPGNLRKWKSAHYDGDFYFFLENLPVEEPRNYARITYQNFFHYRGTYMLHPGD